MIYCKRGGWGYGEPFAGTTCSEARPFPPMLGRLLSGRYGEQWPKAAPSLPWPQSPDPEAAAIGAWQADAVAAALVPALNHLNQRGRQVITAAYGLDGQGACSLAAIGRRYGVSRERVRQWRNDALVLLRHPTICGQLSVLSDQNDRQGYRRRQRLSQRWLRRRRGRGR
jgi:hypothetical protein